MIEPRPVLSEDPMSFRSVVREIAEQLCCQVPMFALKPVSVALLLAVGSVQPVAGQVGSAARSDTATNVEMLFVQSAKRVTLTNGKLTLMGVAPTTVFFSDRPRRIAGHLATTEMIPLWSEGRNSFLKDPPNATLSAFTADSGVVNAVVVLKNPVLSGDQMTYDVTVTQGRVPSASDGVSLFIDIIGMPLTPLSFAGAERRAYRRAVVFGTPYLR